MIRAENLLSCFCWEHYNVLDRYTNKLGLKYYHADSVNKIQSIHNGGLIETVIEIISQGLQSRWSAIKINLMKDPSLSDLCLYIIILNFVFFWTSILTVFKQINIHTLQSE